MRFLWAFLFALPLAAADIAVAPQALSFVYQFNSQILVPQTIVITSPASVPFTGSRPSADTWLLPSNPSFTGNTPAVLTVDINPGKLGLGSYTSAITFRFPQGTIAVPVNLTITGAPILAVQPAIVVFDNTTAFVNLAVGLSSGEPFLITATTATPWLKVQGVTSPLLISASSGIAGLALSVGAIQVRSSSVLQVANNPLSVPVVFLGNSLSSLGPLTIAPAVLTFNGNATQQVSVTGGTFTATSDAKWLTAMVSGQTLSVTANASGLAPGAYQGTVTLLSGGVLQMLPASLTVATTLPPSLVKVVNAASYGEGGISPGEVVTLGGTNLGPTTLAGLTLDSSGSVSTLAGGVQVLFNGIAAPMIYAGATQVAAVAPYDLDGKPSAAVQVSVNGQVSNTVNVPVVALAPGVFTSDASGAGGGAILNSDNSFNGPDHPAAKGEVVSVYMTGEGQTAPAGVNGKVTATPPTPLAKVAATVDGQPATVTFAGEAPSLVSGVMQVNVQVPATARAGGLPIVITVGGIPSQNGVTVSVR
jgi:uncharacterized protein (TIGR03437 family)